MRTCLSNNADEVTTGAADSLLSWIDDACRDASCRLDPQYRARMGQFLTRGAVAMFMAGMFECEKQVISVLDPGAGAGSLSAAFVLAMCRRQDPPNAIVLSAYEIDADLVNYLRKTIDLCQAVCDEAQIRFDYRIVSDDFLETGASTFAGDLFADGDKNRYDCAILNPPYRKIRTASRERKLLRAIGLETTNLYAGFLAVTARLLAQRGEMVAITPRSFCNGPYFEPFRHYFLRGMRFRRVHVFDARDRAFADDQVLQENIVFRAIKTEQDSGDVVVSASIDTDESSVRRRTIMHDELILPHDDRAVIHIVPEADGDSIRRRIENLESSLADLGLSVSTGRLVAFRAKELLREQPGRDTVPLIHPCHLKKGLVEWPNGGTRKPNNLAVGPRTSDLLVPCGYYVLTKRFSAKEERRRIAAAVYDPARVASSPVAFENHLNYYHAAGCGLSANLAQGLAAFLNSSLVDVYFRQFSGHTQVNASDLRALRYPTHDQLVALGGPIGRSSPAQEDLDQLVEEFLPGG